MTALSITSTLYIAKDSLVEAFKYDGDFINSNGEKYVPYWAFDALDEKVLDFVGQGTLMLNGLEVVPVGTYVFRNEKGTISTFSEEVFEAFYKKAS